MNSIRFDSRVFVASFLSSTFTSFSLKLFFNSPASLQYVCLSLHSIYWIILTLQLHVLCVEVVFHTVSSEIRFNFIIMIFSIHRIKFLQEFSSLQTNIGDYFFFCKQPKNSFELSWIHASFQISQKQYKFSIGVIVSVLKSNYLNRCCKRKTSTSTKRNVVR